MRSARATVLALLALLALAAAPAAAEAPQPQPQPPQPRIAPGITAGGIDLSNLTVAEATAKLNAEVAPRLQRSVVVRGANKRFELTAAVAKVEFDAERTAKRALQQTAPKAGTKLEVPLATRHSRIAVRNFVERIAKGLYLRPRNATLRITIRKMRVRRARVGRALRKPETFARKIDLALDSATRKRLLRPAYKRVRPRTNANDLARIYRTVLTVDRTTYRLRLFKGLRFRKAYRIAVGMAGYDTPRGLYRITNKAVNPAWHVPNSPWAGGLQGQTIPGGAPNNPLKARWLGITDGVGIHGTAEEWSIGTRASHGCIRMRVSDVKDLYPRVPVGSRVLIR